MNGQQTLVALNTIIVKEIRRFMRIWVQTLIPPVITMTLYFVIFGNLIGSRVGEMGGYDYMQFIVPGLVMMSVITSSYANVVSSFFGTKFQRSIEELMVSPVPSHIIIAGYVIGGAVRGILTGVLVTCLSLFFTDLVITHLWLTLATLIMTAILFSLGGFINAVFATKFDDVTIVPTFVLTPLTYLGGVFYSIDLLSDFWATVSLINPIVYMVNAFRFGILGVSDVSIFVSFFMSFVFIAILSAWAWILLERGVGMRT